MKWLSKISYASGKLEVRLQNNNNLVALGKGEAAVGLQTVLAEAEAVFADAKKQASMILLWNGRAV